MTHLNRQSPRFSVSIMAHPERVERAERLKHEFTHRDVRVVLDPEPGGPPNALRTARQAWQPHGEGTTHHLVLQDDATLHTQFVTNLQAMIDARPKDAIALFVEWGSYCSYALRVAHMSGCAWTEVVDGYFPTVAAVVPNNVATVIANSLPSSDGIDDVEVGAILARISGTRMLASVPSIVQHDGDLSLVGNNHHGIRRAAIFPDSLSPASWQQPMITNLRRLPVLHFLHAEAIALAREERNSGRGDWKDLRQTFPDAPESRIIEIREHALRLSGWGNEDEQPERFLQLLEVVALCRLAAGPQPKEQSRTAHAEIADGWVRGALRIDPPFAAEPELNRAILGVQIMLDLVAEGLLSGDLSELDLTRAAPNAASDHQPRRVLTN